MSEAQGVLRPATHTWLEEFLFPRYLTAGLRAIITVSPEDAITDLSIQSWTKAGKPCSFDMVLAHSMSEAKELAKTYVT